MIFIDVNKRLKNFELKINLEIENNLFLGVIGKSGSGKSTFLRILAGLEKANGNIVVDNEIWLDNKKFLPPQKRSIGFVFQNYALFPNMSVLENLLYVKNDKKFAFKLLEMVGMENFKDRYPINLSGGEKQRVALIRALMRRPKLLLMDEPFSALDFDIKKSLIEEIKRIHNEFNLTTILVSHSFFEIENLAEKVVEIDKGKVIRKFNIKNTAKIIEKMNKNILKVELNGKISYVINMGKRDYKKGDFVKISKEKFYILKEDNESSVG